MYIYLKISFWLIFSLSSACSTSVEQDLSLTLEEKLVLEKFGEVLRPRLPHSYMKKDIYLIRWLRARNFDLAGAERMLMNNLKWREDNKMDGILEEDFSDLEREYKYYIEGLDVDGKPVAYINYGEWDVRKAALSGNFARSIRYLDKFLEEITTLIRKMQSQGTNVTQYSFVMNLAGFNLIEHACIQCLPAYISFLDSYENHFPGAADNMFLVNTPGVFEVVLNAARFAMSKTTRDALQIYGTNKRDWQPKLFKAIPRESLPRDVGGTRIYNTDDYNYN